MCIVFKYWAITHAVDEVRANDYKNCNTDNIISSDQTSPTNFSLVIPGPRYFICPKSDHCTQGMKLAINVVDPNTTKGNAPARLGPGNSFMLGFSILVGAIVGIFMT